MEALAEDARNFKTAHAVAIVQLCFNGQKSLEQSRNAVKNWNQIDKWKLTTRSLASGRKQLAVTTPAELSKVLERCSRGGADAALVAEVGQRLNPLLGPTGKEMAIAIAR